MRKYFNILPLVLALFLSACGVKKNATAEVSSAKATQPATTEQAETATEMSLAQRVASGEFAWLDTISNVLEINIAGPYKLSYQENKDGENMRMEDVFADSLVLLDNGYYKKYKSNILVDYGKYFTKRFDTIMICKQTAQDPIALFKNGTPYFFTITLYNWNQVKSQYVLPALPTYKVVLGLSFLYKVYPCESIGESDSYKTGWETANREILDRLKRHQQYVDSLYHTIPVFNGEW